MLLVRRLRWPSLLLAHGEDAASEDAAIELQRLADADPSVCAQRRVLRLAEDGRGDSDAAWAISKGERQPRSRQQKGVSTLRVARQTYLLRIATEDMPLYAVPPVNTLLLTGRIECQWCGWLSWSLFSATTTTATAMVRALR